MDAGSFCTVGIWKYKYIGASFHAHIQARPLYLLLSLLMLFLRLYQAAPVYVITVSHYRLFFSLSLCLCVLFASSARHIFTVRCNAQAPHQSHFSQVCDCSIHRRLHGDSLDVTFSIRHGCMAIRPSRQPREAMHRKNCSSADSMCDSIQKLYRIWADISQRCCVFVIYIM